MDYMRAAVIGLIVIAVVAILASTQARTDTVCVALIGIATGAAGALGGLIGGHKIGGAP